MILSTPRAGAETIRFEFARCGNSYSAAIFAGDPRIGRRIVSANIGLEVRIVPPGDGANFTTDITFPISPAPGNTSTLVLEGRALGWQGGGTFRYGEFTDRFNGTLRAGRYGAETFGVNCLISEGSYIEMTFESTRCPADVDDGSGSGTPDGAVTIDDLLFYLRIYATGAPAADLDDGTGTGSPDGGVTLDDLLFFIGRFETGC